VATGSALHDALLHPGDADLARAAAEEVAIVQDRMASINRRLAVLIVAGAVLMAVVLATLGKVW
jgi:hypothetical protein